MNIVGAPRQGPPCSSHQCTNRISEPAGVWHWRAPGERGEAALGQPPKEPGLEEAERWQAGKNHDVRTDIRRPSSSPAMNASGMTCSAFPVFAYVLVTFQDGHLEAAPWAIDMLHRMRAVCGYLTGPPTFALSYDS